MLGVIGTSESAPYPAGESTCGPLYGMGIGPLDYQSAPGTDVLKLVESAHFTPGVESLTKGSTGTFGGDLDYTLRAYPNHYRALATMSRLQFKEKKPQPNGARWPVACYFERATRWRPNDANVRLVYGIHLFKDGFRKEAVEQLEMAVSLGLDTGNVHYNLGLALLETGDFEGAIRHAVRAYRLGFSLPALKTKLQKAGKWPNQEEEERIAQSFDKDEVETSTPEKVLPAMPENYEAASN